MKALHHCIVTEPPAEPSPVAARYVKTQKTFGAIRPSLWLRMARQWCNIFNFFFEGQAPV